MMLLGVIVLVALFLFFFNREYFKLNTCDVQEVDRYVNICDCKEGKYFCKENPECERFHGSCPSSPSVLLCKDKFSPMRNCTAGPGIPFDPFNEDLQEAGLYTDNYRFRQTPSHYYRYYHGKCL